MSLLLAAADVDPVWAFIAFAIGFIVAVVMAFMARGFDLGIVGLAAVSIGGMLLSWP